MVFVIFAKILSPVWLLAQTEFFDQGAIALAVCFFEVVEQLAPLVHHLEQAHARMVILGVRLKMTPEFLDVRRQQRHLDFGRSGVALVGLIFLQDLRLRFSREGHDSIASSQITWFSKGAYSPRRQPHPQPAQATAVTGSCPPPGACAGPPARPRAPAPCRESGTRPHTGAPTPRGSGRGAPTPAVPGADRRSPAR